MKEPPKLKHGLYRRSLVLLDRIKGSIFRFGEKIFENGKSENL